MDRARCFHFVLDRAKPGTAVVDQTGRRFLNESSSYNLFAKADGGGCRSPSVPAFSSPITVRSQDTALG
jgi:hypothetical protein